MHIKEALSQLSLTQDSNANLTNETNGSMSPTRSSRITEEQVVAMLMRVSELSRPIAPQRAVAIALELVQMNMTYEDIEQGCRRYAVSIASQFREIQLSDFTNPTITSEHALRLEVERLTKERKAFEEEKRRVAAEVERQVESRLSSIYIELSKIASCFPTRQVTANRAIESVLAILRDEQRQAVNKLTERLKEEVMKNLEFDLRARLADALSQLDTQD